MLLFCKIVEGRKEEGEYMGRKINKGRREKGGKG
jgi:hypothetical protein